MTTLPAVGATGGRPREPLNLGHLIFRCGYPDPELRPVDETAPYIVGLPKSGG